MQVLTYSILSGEEDLNRKLVIATVIVAGALIISLAFNLHYYVNLRRENQNMINTIRARALWTYGAEIGMVAIYLEEYLDTLNFDIIDQEVHWAIYRAKVQADLLKEGLTEDSGLMYYELSRTIRTLENYFVYDVYGPVNATKVEFIIQSLKAIKNTITSDFDIIENEDPLDHLEKYSRLGIGLSVDEVINYCQQIQEVVQ
jgi:hypothetical protein